MRNCAGRIGRSPPSRADSGSIIVLPATMGDRWGDGLATRLDVKKPLGLFYVALAIGSRGEGEDVQRVARFVPGVHEIRLLVV